MHWFARVRSWFRNPSAHGSQPQPWPWINEFGGPSPDARPAYDDLSQQPWAQEIAHHWSIIRAELESFLSTDEQAFAPYFKDEQVSRRGRWRLYPFCYWGFWFPKRGRPFPRTVALLRQVPGLTTATFSLLKAGTDIVSHRGDTDAMARCHLGLIIPAPAPTCALEVNGEVRGWQEGQWLAFCDAHPHRAWNHSTEDRVVLFLDVIRPEYRNQYGRICLVIWFTVVLQWLEAHLPLLITPLRKPIKSLAWPLLQRLPPLPLAP